MLLRTTRAFGYASRGRCRSMVRLLDADAPYGTMVGVVATSAARRGRPCARSRGDCKNGRARSTRVRSIFASKLQILPARCESLTTSPLLERRTMRLEERRRRCIDQVRAACGSAHFTHLQLRVAADARSIDSLRRVTKHRREATAEQLRARRGLSARCRGHCRGSGSRSRHADRWTSHRLCARRADHRTRTPPRRTSVVQHWSTTQKRYARI